MTEGQIPKDFLRGPPPNATLRKLNFEKTNPPIPAFKGQFAAIVENLITEAECKEFIRLAEESTRTELPDSTLSPPKWVRAMVNVGDGREVMSTDHRKSQRIIFDSFDLAGRVMDRLMPFMRECEIDVIKNQPRVTGRDPASQGEVLRLTRLNERLRVLRYEGGDYFRPHCDGCYVTPDGKELSLFTIHLYLNGDGEQDMEELKPHIERAEKRNRLFKKFDLAPIDSEEVGVGSKEHPSALESADKSDTLLGGATSFTDGFILKNSVRIFPKAGSVLIFQQRNMLHGGDDVFRGVKYTVRTDVMYASV
ncbi:Prolyl 4-hydroxylase alpha subunit [Penicillium soppii]|uniref:Prolyl 4-hydroxylase alpha subunit n=1 Tax=Penicillium soppii TaxID=69789 RepID=UPI0025493B5C|nr:Prolyl 4-hydroxylase alpha subunit [Penicillium soppii]KAJ5860798.1 Prolyl 4-hydroxylase alpha subunit [Penicillium soppii]